MIVYFSGSARDIKDDIKIYRKIIRAIQEEGGILVRNWPEMAHEHEILPREKDWWIDLHEGVKDAIEDADVVVVEASGRSTLGVGFELALALHAKKPTLILVEVTQELLSYVTGMVDRLIKQETYTEDTIKKKVRDFLRRIKEGEGR